MKKLFLVFICLAAIFTGCNQSDVPVATSEPSNSTITPGESIDTSMFKDEDVKYVQEEIAAGNYDSLLEYALELEACNDISFARYVRDEVQKARSSGRAIRAARSAVTEDTTRYYNGRRVTSSAWKKFVKQFQYYSNHIYHSQYGDLMKFNVEGKELYFIYGFDNGVTDSYWDNTIYASTLTPMLAAVTVADGTMPTYGEGVLPPTCGTIIGIDDSVPDSSNGIMFLLAAEHHTNWGTAYCYDSNGYSGYGDGVHTDCYIPMHVVFYADGIHIRQACYVSYTVILPECSYCTACFRQKSIALANTPYNKGDWTYETEYGPRAALHNGDHLMSGYFKE